MQLSIPPASELGPSLRVGDSYNPTSLGIAVWSEQWEPPGLGPETGRLQEAQASSLASYPLCCSEAQRLGPVVIVKMENVVRPHDGASLTCLFAAGALCTPNPTLSCLEEAEKAEFAVCGGEAKKSFPSPKTQAGGGEERGIGINLVSALVPPQ